MLKKTKHKQRYRDEKRKAKVKLGIVRRSILLGENLCNKERELYLER